MDSNYCLVMMFSEPKVTSSLLHLYVLRNYSFVVAVAFTYLPFLFINLNF